MLSENERTFLLTPKSLPTSSHYQNLRTFFGQSKWDIIRKQVYQKFNWTCVLCNSQPSRLEAHEIWDFDFEHKIQYLNSIVPLCSKCHAIQHTSLLYIHHDQGIRNAQWVVNHYNKLTNNHLTFNQFFAYAQKESSKYEGIEWDIVFHQDFSL